MEHGDLLGHLHGCIRISKDLKGFRWISRDLQGFMKMCNGPEKNIIEYAWDPNEWGHHNGSPSGSTMTDWEIPDVGSSSKPFWMTLESISQKFTGL